MMNRHGLIAGATGPARRRRCRCIAEQLSAQRRAGVRRGRQGRPVRAWRRRATRTARARSACRARPRRTRRPASPSSSSRSAASAPGVPVRATVSDFGPQLLAKVLGPTRRRSRASSLVFHYADAQGAAAARPRRPARAADVPGLRRGQGRARGHRRAVEGDGRRAAARARRPRGRRRQRVLRRAAVRRSPTCCASRRTAAA